jgi:pyridoxal 5'-phosphate synthase pdxS subunit
MRYLDEAFRVKVGLAEMLKGGVIMDVTDAQTGGDRREGRRLRRDGARTRSRRHPQGRRRGPHVGHSHHPRNHGHVSIPVMAKVRIGHFAEAQVLEALEVDYIDESEVLTPADEEFHIDKRGFKVPFVCGCRNLGEALRRIAEGAAMIRTKGEAGSGNIVEAVRHMRTIVREMKQLTVLGDEELVAESKKLGAPLELVEYVHNTANCPCPTSRPAASPRRPMPRSRAAWRRGRLRRLGHLQELRPRDARQGDRQGQHQLHRPQSRARGQRGTRRGHARSRHSKLPESELMQTRGW